MEYYVELTVDNIRSMIVEPLEAYLEKTYEEVAQSVAQFAVVDMSALRQVQ